MEKTPTTLPSGQGNQVTKIHDLLRDSACGHQPAERPATSAVYHQGHINKTCKPSPSVSVMPMGVMNVHSMKSARPSKDSSPHPQASHHFQTGLGLLGNVWDGRRADHHRRLSWEYQQSNQYKYPIWDYSSYNTNSNAQVVYHSSPFKGDALEYQVTGPFLGDLGNFAGDFPMFLWELPQAPNFLVYTDISKPRLQSCSKNAAPNVCILALAMMIAGIPTVPVPGVREEDMIAAAQTFMEGKYEVYTGTECKWRTEGHPSHVQPYSM